MSGIRPLSKRITERIKEELGGEWFAFINPIGDESYELFKARVKEKIFLLLI